MPEAYQRLGRLVASGKSMTRREFQDCYSSEFMTALQAIATPRRQANVLQHMLGYFKQALDRESRAELLALIQDYAGGRVPLAAPLTLFAHHIRRCRVPYLAEQVYLRPHPVELMFGAPTCDGDEETSHHQRSDAARLRLLAYPLRSAGTSRRGSRRI